MKILPVALCLFASFALGAETTLEFPELDLTDGRKLTNVVVKSYDAPNDKVLLVADGKATSILAKIIPAPFADQIRATARKAGNTVNSMSAPLPRPAASANQPVPAGGQSSNPYGIWGEASKGQAVRPQPMPRPTSPAPVQSPAVIDLVVHKNIALAHVDRFMHFEFVPGSDNLRLLDYDLDAGDPKPVTGWPGRYRTEGKVLFRIHDWKTRIIQPGSLKFEVVTEQKPGEKPVVVSFARQS